MMPEQSGHSHADPVYFLLHIPKTAGQTIQQHLAEHCAPGIFWQSSRRVNFSRGDCSNDLPDPSRARIIAGHHISRSFQNLFPNREIRPILLLRDPLELQISFYNWQMMNNIAIGVGIYGFNLHLRALPLNFMTDFLLWSWLEIPRGALRVMAEGKKYDILNRMMAEFWFVGAHTDCDRLIAQIGPDLGVPPTARRRNTSAALQLQTGWRLLTSASLPAAMRCAFRARNRVDQALWENWRAAGFNSAAIHPPLLQAGRKRGLSTHEIVRPWFKLRRFAARQRGSWLRSTNAGAAKLMEADRARDAGQWKLAARCYREALRTLPKGPAIWVQYGHALKETGSISEAEEAYRKALRLNPGSADIHLQLGHVLKLQGRIGMAEEAYWRSLFFDPTGRHARDELIGLGWTTERVEQAIADRPAAQLQPRSGGPLGTTSALSSPR
jgi:TPR repeat